MLSTVKRMRRRRYRNKNPVSCAVHSRALEEKPQNRFEVNRALVYMRRQKSHLLKRHFLLLTLSGFKVRILSLFRPCA